MPHTTGFEYQTASFRNGHKVTYNFRMSHRYRPATLYLIAKTGNDRTVRPQNIAETGSDKLRETSAFRL